MPPPPPVIPTQMIAKKTTGVKILMALSAVTLGPMLLPLPIVVILILLNGHAMTPGLVWVRQYLLYLEFKHSKLLNNNEQQQSRKAVVRKDCIFLSIGTHTHIYRYTGIPRAAHTRTEQMHYDTYTKPFRNNLQKKKKNTHTHTTKTVSFLKLKIVFFFPSYTHTTHTAHIHIHTCTHAQHIPCGFVI